VDTIRLYFAPYIIFSAKMLLLTYYWRKKNLTMVHLPFCFKEIIKIIGNAFFIKLDDGEFSLRIKE